MQQRDAASIVHAIADAILAEQARASYWAASATETVPTQLGQGSLEEAAAIAGRAQLWAKQLRELDTPTLTRADELLRRRALFEADWLAQSFDVHLYTFHPTPYQLGMVAADAQQAFHGLKLDGPEDADRYLQLVQSYARYFDDMRATLREQRGRGLRYPRAALPGSEATVRGIAAGLPNAATLGLDRLAAKDAARLRDGVDRIVATELRPAVEALLADLQGPCSETSSDQVGLHQYPDGDRIYDRLIRYHTTLDVSADELHREGIELVAELEARMAEVRAELGHNGDQASFHERLATDPRVHATTADEVRGIYLRHLRNVEEVFGRWFGDRRVPPYDVRRLPLEAEPGMTFGFYRPPNPQAGEDGCYFFNGSDLANRSTIGAASLALHEIVPGHHLHLATDLLAESRHRLRRLPSITAYNEGWAEYAADLGWEMGIYRDPYDRYGRLVTRLFLATRLVADTGLNRFGWSLDRARSYMREHSMMSDVELASETLRYATSWPGQALGYASGCTRILQLRRDMEQMLGNEFDVISFHDAVLEGSSLSLGDLRWHVETTLGVA